MNATATKISDVPALSHDEAVLRAREENARLARFVTSLPEADWTARTDCPAWDVRQLVAHLVGAMEGHVSPRVFIHQLAAGKKAAGNRPDVDGMTEVQVRERDHLTPAELTARLVDLAPKAAHGRARLPALLRKALRFKVDVGGVMEPWTLGYLVDVVLTRDPWMHRIDLARATGRPLELTADHDGRIVADVVAEWARRHRQPFSLVLSGPAGGLYESGSGGAAFSMDAIEFCRTLSGRAPGEGLLAQVVPF